MAFSDYKTISQVQKEFGVKYQEDNFIAAQATEPPVSFREEFEFKVHGIVTDGELWKFGKLVGDVFTSNIEGYTVSNLARLFGAIHYIFQAISRNDFPTPA